MTSQLCVANDCTSDYSLYLIYHSVSSRAVMTGLHSLDPVVLIHNIFNNNYSYSSNIFQWALSYYIFGDVCNLCHCLV